MVNQKHSAECIQTNRDCKENGLAPVCYRLAPVMNVR